MLALLCASIYVREPAAGRLPHKRPHERRRGMASPLSARRVCFQPRHINNNDGVAYWTLGGHDEPITPARPITSNPPRNYKIGGTRLCRRHCRALCEGGLRCG